MLFEMEAKLGLVSRDRRAASLINGIMLKLNGAENDSEKLDSIRPMIAELSEILEGKDGV